MTVIYHGTPLTPRAALLDVCTGRAMCVSFYRPDDVEAVEVISPAIMYDNGAFSFWQQAKRSGQEWAEDRDWTPFLSLAGASPVSSGPMGSHPRHAGGTIPAQRRAVERMAFRAGGCTALAHGWADRALGQAVRTIRAGLSRMGRRDAGRPASGLPSLPQAHGRCIQAIRQSLAGHPHDARDSSGAGLSIHQRGQHEPCSERTPLRQPYGRIARRQVARTARLRRQAGGQAR